MTPQTKQAPPQREAASVPVTLRGKEVPAYQEVLDINDLRFYPDNPRVYSVVRADGRIPSQEEIQASLQKMDHVKELIQQIKRNGGLIDPLFVKAGSNEVIEGNSRLAALRFLSEDDHIKWRYAKCIVLPHDLDDRSIATLLGQWHLRGKKEWQPYEQAGFLYRRHKLQGVDLDTLSKEVGLTRGKVAQAINAYAFMQKADDKERGHWSYYDEYTKSKLIKRARDKHPKLDHIIVKGIKEETLPKAQDFRDKMPTICRNEKALKRFVRGDADFEEAHTHAAEAGADHTPLKRLKTFRTWLAEDDVQTGLSESAGTVRKNIKFELGHIQRIAARILRDFE